MVLPSLRRLFGYNKPVAARPRPGCRVRLALEVLECRVVPSTLHVGSASGEYHHIQDAVTAASPGDTIVVDSGTYPEQVTINKSLDLEGNNQNSIIKLPLTAPASQSTAIVEITGATTNVTINKFTVEGPGSGFGSIGYGIEVNGGAAANITNDHVTAITDNPLSGAQNGTGILVGQDVHATTPTTGTATISHDTVDDYQKRGIEVGGVGSNAEIDHTTVTGVGATGAIAQNGIEILDGATANVNHDTISGNVYTPLNGAMFNTASGILVFNSGAVTVDQNMLSGNDVAIYVFAPTGRADLEQNQISGSTFDGIVLDDVSGAYLSQNQIATSGLNLSQSQMAAFSASGDGSGGDGIALVNDSTGNDLEQNQSKNNGHDGIFVQAGSTGNTFNQNQMQTNGNLDVEDLTTGAGTDHTGNTWTQNHGKTSNPPGLVS